MKHLLVSLLALFGITLTSLAQETPANPVGRTAVKTDVSLSCAPLDSDPHVFTAPEPGAIHPDWKDGGIGTSWSFAVTQKIESDKGVFLYGHLITPKGDDLEGNCYIIMNEWDCIEQ